MTFAEALKLARTKRGLTKYRLAKMLRIHQQTGCAHHHHPLFGGLEQRMGFEAADSFRFYFICVPTAFGQKSIEVALVFFQLLPEQVGDGGDVALAGNDERGKQTVALKTIRTDAVGMFAKPKQMSHNDQGFPLPATKPLCLKAVLKAVG